MNRTLPLGQHKPDLPALRPASSPPPRGFASRLLRGGTLAPRVGRVHPLMAPMYWAAIDVLAHAIDLGSTSLPSASELRASFSRELATMLELASAQGIAPEDVHDAQYALVAFVDEQLSLARHWQGHAEWCRWPLQLGRYGENTAGEAFFRRLAFLEGQPHRAHVLQIYFLCLAAGFQGRFAVTGSAGLATIYERVGRRISEAAGHDVLSPHAESRDERTLFRKEAPLVKIGAAILAAATVVFLLLKGSLAWDVRSSTQSMRDAADTHHEATPLGTH